MSIKISDLKNDLLPRVFSLCTSRGAISRYAARLENIKRTRRFIARGKGELAESSERRKLYRNREINQQIEELRVGKRLTKNYAVGFERVIGETRDILSVEFLQAGTMAAESVGRVSVLGETEFGTGFLVGNGLMLTNNHVLEDEDTAASSTLELDYEANRFGPVKNMQSFDFDPDRFFLTSVEYDFTLVAVNEKSDGGRPLADFGWHPIIGQQGKIRVGDPVSIIHHPGGGLKSVVVHNSHFLYLENNTELEKYFWYSSDTEPGSSGAPVFNTRWEIVALHHKAVPRTNDKGEIIGRNGRPLTTDPEEVKSEDIQWIANEGIRASRVVRTIREAEIADPDQKKIRDDLLDLWKRPRAQTLGQESQRYRPASEVVGMDGATLLPLRLLIEVDKPDRTG